MRPAADADRGVQAGTARPGGALSHRHGSHAAEAAYRGTLIPARRRTSTDTAGTCTLTVDFTNHYREALLAVRDTVTTSGQVLGVGWMPSRGFELSQDLDEAVAMSSQGITSMTDEGVRSTIPTMFLTTFRTPPRTSRSITASQWRWRVRRQQPSRRRTPTAHRLVAAPRTRSWRRWGSIRTSPLTGPPSLPRREPKDFSQ